MAADEILVVWPYPSRGGRAHGTGDQDALFVIRPDGYIAFRSVPADTAAARACLSRALTPA
jgi:hypothetical protein